MAGSLLVLAAALSAWAGPTKVVVEVPLVAPVGGALGTAANASAPAPSLTAPSLAAPVLPTVVPGLGASPALAVSPSPVAVPAAAVQAQVLPARHAQAAAVPASLPAGPGVLSPSAVPAALDTAGREAPAVRASLDGAVRTTRGLDKADVSAGAGAASLAFDGGAARAAMNAVLPNGQGFGRRPPTGLSAAKSDALPGLAEKGWAVSAPGTFVPEGLPERFEAFMKAKRASLLDVHGSDVIELYDMPLGWKPDVGTRADGTGGFKELLEAAEAALHASLPGEKFSMRDAHVRVIRNGLPGGEKIHADLGGYMTLTLALEGPGTVVYLNEAGRWTSFEAPTGAASVITNAERETVTGAEATIHSAPNRVLARRTVLIVRYKPDVPLDASARKATLERAKARAESARRASEPTPDQPTVAGFLKGLFGR